jgi:hypothetical protein
VKLRAGDIEIDGETGMTLARGRRREDPPRPVHDAGCSPYRLLGVSLPALPARVYWGLSALGLAGIAGCVALLPALLAGNAFLAVCALVPPLFGLALGSAVIARRAGRARASRPGLDALRATRIAALLSTAEVPLDVARIAGALGWTEDAVVAGLAYLVERARAQEDLDLETGCWVYALATRGDALTPAALSIRERQRAIPGRAAGHGD